jgi:N-acetylneuraminic acid mutarotase
MKRILYTLLLFLPFITEAQFENQWLKKNDFPGLKRARATSFVIDENAYIFGGVDTAETVLRDLWQYDPVLDTWVQKADLPGSVRREAIAFTIDDFGYVGTGIDSNEATLGNSLKDFWQYNPTTNTWLQKADFPGYSGQGIYFATGFSIDGKGYLCGGKIGPNFYSNQLWEYKPLIDQWTLRANFPGGVRYQLSSFVIGLEAFVGFGTDQDVYRKDLHRYRPGSNSWLPCADIPGAPRAGAAAFSIGLRGFICGGTNGGLLDDLWEYNPFSNSWAIRSPFGGSERKNAIAFALNGKGFVGTGTGYSGKKASVHEYSPLQSVYLELDEAAMHPFTVYPNPAENQISIEVENEKATEFVLYSIMGRKVLQEQFVSGQKIIFDRNAIPSGVYLISLRDKSGQEISRHQQLILQ